MDSINRLSTIWKSDLTDKMKRSFFQAEVISILLYGCTTWTLTKRLEKKYKKIYLKIQKNLFENIYVYEKIYLKIYMYTKKSI